MFKVGDKVRHVEPQWTNKYVGTITGFNHHSFEGRIFKGNIVRWYPSWGQDNAAYDDSRLVLIMNYNDILKGLL